MKIKTSDCNMQIPSSTELEELVLGELIMSSSKADVNRAAAYLTEEMFSSEQARTLWKAILAESMKSDAWDSAVLGKAVGAKYVAKVLCAANTAGISYLSISRHIDLLVDRYRHRQAWMVAQNLLGVACDDTTSVDDIFGVVSPFLHQLNTEAQLSFAQGMSELGNEFADLLQKGRPDCVPTGFSKLDRLFRGGFPKSELVILAGRPGTGKTSFGCFMMRAAASSGYNAVMFSLEQSNREIFEKLMYGTGKLMPEGVDKGKIDWASYESGLSQLEKLKILLTDSCRTIDQLCCRISELHSQGRCDIAFIDYLGLIPVKMENGVTLSQAIGENTRKLKAIAMDLGIPIVLMCQLNRTAAREDREPRLTDLRDSGNIEQDADKVLMIDKRDGNLALWVRKNRQGIGGDEVIPLKADGVYCNFTEI